MINVCNAKCVPMKQMMAMMIVVMYVSRNNMASENGNEMIANEIMHVI